MARVPVPAGGLRPHLAGRHPGVRLANLLYPHGRPLADLAWAHRTQHRQFPGDQDHDHTPGDLEAAETEAGQ